MEHGVTWGAKAPMNGAVVDEYEVILRFRFTFLHNEQAPLLFSSAHVLFEVEKFRRKRDEPSA